MDGGWSRSYDCILGGSIGRYDCILGGSIRYDCILGGRIFSRPILYDFLGGRRKAGKRAMAASAGAPVDPPYSDRILDGVAHTLLARLVQQPPKLAVVELMLAFAEARQV